MSYGRLWRKSCYDLPPPALLFIVNTSVWILKSAIYLCSYYHTRENSPNDLITISISLINHPDQLEPCTIQHNHLVCSDGAQLICNDENMIEIAVVIVKRWQKCA